MIVAGASVPSESFKPREARERFPASKGLLRACGFPEDGGTCKSCVRNGFVAQDRYGRSAAWTPRHTRASSTPLSLKARTRSGESGAASIFQPYGRTSLSLFRIEGFEKSAKLFPRDYLFHFGEKEFPFCGFSVFLERNGARESFLSLHRTSAPWKEGRTGGTWWLWDSFYGLKGKTATSARSFSEIP